jgi:hypothetical protein
VPRNSRQTFGAERGFAAQRIDCIMTRKQQKLKRMGIHPKRKRKCNVHSTPL